MSPAPIPLPSALATLLDAAPQSSIFDPAFAAYADALPASLSNLRAEFYFPTKSSAAATERTGAQDRAATAIFSEGELAWPAIWTPVARC